MSIHFQTNKQGKPFVLIFMNVKSYSIDLKGACSKLNLHFKCVFISQSYNPLKIVDG